MNGEGSFKACSINLTFWWIVWTHTEWVSLAPAKMECFGRSSANLEKPILAAGCFSLKFLVELLQIAQNKLFLNVHPFPIWLFNRNEVLHSWHQPAGFITSIEIDNNIYLGLGNRMAWLGVRSREDAFLTSFLAVRAMKFDTPNSFNFSNRPTLW